jgi:hypothetical protein
MRFYYVRRNLHIELRRLALDAVGWLMQERCTSFPEPWLEVQKFPGAAPSPHAFGTWRLPSSCWRLAVPYIYLRRGRIKASGWQNSRSIVLGVLLDYCEAKGYGGRGRSCDDFPGFSFGGVGVIRGLFNCGTSPHAEGS